MRIALLAVAGICLSGCSQPGRRVVVYTSLDQPFSEPVLKAFEARTGIAVRAVYDVEATKTTGLVNRLLAEKDRPQADVFWNSEISRTLVLRQKGVLAPYRSPFAADIPDAFRDPAGYWTGFAARARVLIVNTGLIREQDFPNSIFELAEPKWRGQVALAYPLFGTTSMHVAALFAALGQEKAGDYFRRLQQNGVVILDGNAATRDRVVAGDCRIGFTDTDDAHVAIRAGRPVRMIYPDQDGVGTLLIPNTVALIANAPHPEAGQRLIDYLLSREVEEMLARSDSAQIPLRSGVPTPPHVRAASAIRSLPVSFQQIATHLDDSMKFAQQLFVR